MPPRERVLVTENWRVAHSFNTSLRGWLVALPIRHVVALAQLTPAEAAELGPLLIRLSAALHVVTGCTKTYVIQFAEASGFSHVHFHVIPRMSWFTDGQRGLSIFTFLSDVEDNWVPAEEMDRVALSVRSELERS